MKRSPRNDGPDVLTRFSNADIMSDMKTFTVRDLDRAPALVLDAAEADGAVIVKRRDGRTYRIQPESAKRPAGKLPDFEARMRAQGMVSIPPNIAKAVDRLIAGE
jgi:hypothetical protein